jgi:integrase/recombinase XerD
MVTLHLRFVVSDRDRHGNVRYYFRRKGEKKVRLHGIAGSKEFMDAYDNALSLKYPLGATTVRAFDRGSFGYVCQLYYSNAIFRKLNVQTQSWRRRVLEEICRQYGAYPIAGLQARHVRKLRNQKSEFPSAADARLKALRALFKFALEEELVDSDPTIGVKSLPHHTEGHHTWTSEEIAKFEARHPIGTKARLAMALMLYSACRRGDVIGLGPQHIQDGRLNYRQMKNAKRKPNDLSIPVHEDLRRIIDETPRKHMTFLVTEFGKPFSVAGFGNWFREKCDEAGLKHCSGHGLRKAAAAYLAECGATTLQIMAITGHRSIAEVERYTREAGRTKLADGAMAKFKPRT